MNASVAQETNSLGCGLTSIGQWRLSDVIFHFIFHFYRFSFHCTGYHIYQWCGLLNTDRWRSRRRKKWCSVTCVLMIGSFSTMFCLIVDPMAKASCTAVTVRPGARIGFSLAFVIIDGSSMALARTNQTDLVNDSTVLSSRTHFHIHRRQY